MQTLAEKAYCRSYKATTSTTAARNERQKSNRPVHTRDQSAKSNKLEVYFGKKIQYIFRHGCARLKREKWFLYEKSQGF